MAKGCYHYKDMFLMNWEHMKYLLDKLRKTWTDVLFSKQKYRCLGKYSLISK
jgi:hypothetical protein